MKSIVSCSPSVIIFRDFYRITVFKIELLIGYQTTSPWAAAFLFLLPASVLSSVMERLYGDSQRGSVRYHFSFFMSHCVQKRYADWLLPAVSGDTLWVNRPIWSNAKLCFSSSLLSSGVLLSQTGEIQGGWDSVQRDPDSCSWERVWICWW